MPNVIKRMNRMRLRGGLDGELARTEIRDVLVAFEGVTALDGVSLNIERGEILGLIGPNGAGKTTLVNVLSGFQQPNRGSVHLGDHDVSGWAPNRLAEVGLVRTFQGVRSFGGLTVAENIEVGAVGVGASRRDAKTIVQSLLRDLELEAVAHLPAEALPYGAERRVGIARALATKPQFLLLDEPASGLDESETDEISDLIGKIRDDMECGVLVIDHDMRLIMGLCDRLHVLDHGKTLKVGQPDEVRVDEAVLSAYLGAA